MATCRGHCCRESRGWPGRETRGDGRKRDDVGGLPLPVSRMSERWRVGPNRLERRWVLRPSRHTPSWRRLLAQHTDRAVGRGPLDAVVAVYRDGEGAAIPR